MVFIMLLYFIFIFELLCFRMGILVIFFFSLFLVVFKIDLEIVFFVIFKFGDDVFIIILIFES